MTAKEMIAALEAARKRKEVEDYVDEVLEDMSEEDLYCNFRMNGEDMFDFRVTDKSQNKGERQSERVGPDCKSGVFGLSRCESYFPHQNKSKKKQLKT